jgi:hypothetical protein
MDKRKWGLVSGGLITTGLIFWICFEYVPLRVTIGRQISSIPEQIYAGRMCLLSFSKSDWQLKDYPVRFRHQPANNPEWIAQIINWHVFGFGSTKEAAYADLQENFAKIKTRHRPGTRVPIQFASTKGIEAHEAIARDFFRKILSRNIDACFISDSSSLYDLCPTPNDTLKFQEEMNEKIYQTYNCEVSDIRDGNLLKIFERIESTRKAI